MDSKAQGLILVKFYSLGIEEPDDFIDCLKNLMSPPLKCVGYIYEKEKYHISGTHGPLKGNSYNIYYKGLKSRFNEAREICEKYHMNVDRCFEE